MDIKRGIKAVTFGVTMGALITVGANSATERDALNEQEQIDAIHTCADVLVPGDTTDLPDACTGFDFPYDRVTVAKYRSSDSSPTNEVTTTYHLPTPKAFEVKELAVVTTDAEVASERRRWNIALGLFGSAIMTFAGFNIFRRQSLAVTKRNTIASEPVNS